MRRGRSALYYVIVSNELSSHGIKMLAVLHKTVLQKGTNQLRFTNRSPWKLLEICIWIENECGSMVDFRLTKKKLDRISFNDLGVHPNNRPI